MRGRRLLLLFGLVALLSVVGIAIGVDARKATAAPCSFRES
jgi:hypothetical protein